MVPAYSKWLVSVQLELTARQLLSTLKFARSLYKGVCQSPYVPAQTGRPVVRIGNKGGLC